ncbi:phosphodiester glycosidase family protein [Roseateles amylovorans]|uniref:Phosphodiester glycosidase family protein n=1 Tax=Roseateles amylovorans TaxID=2978473 RepID=A0ABY6B174_9BURK|nr:phosphodiester glycosidase family protein [Roseateles amylovorans]UXH78692.1 phosphodiester glycosidase family protein [Roseateles amylovorans]
MLATLLLAGCAHRLAERAPDRPISSPDGLSAIAAGDDTPHWRRVADEPGLLYERDDRRAGQVLHWLRLDLHDSRLTLSLTAPDERGRPLDGFDGATEALAVVNASFFDRSFTPRGWTVSAGQAWAPVLSAATSPMMACDPQPRCVIALQARDAPPAGTWTAVAGTPWLIRDGQPRRAEDDLGCSFCAATHPRTALGLDADGRYLTLVLAEGRRGEVAGLRLAELAALMAARGVHQAFNLDGGGSSSLLIEGHATMGRPFNEPALRRLANALIIRRLKDIAP